MALGAHFQINQATNAIPTGTTDIARIDIRYGQQIHLVGDSSSSQFSPSWTILAWPDGSARAQPTNPTTFDATYTPDVPGTYLVQFLVNDGSGVINAAASNHRQFIIGCTQNSGGLIVDDGVREPAFGELTTHDNAGGNDRSYAKSYEANMARAMPGVSSIANLRNRVASRHKHVNLLGYAAAGDGGADPFVWDAASTEADDGFAIVQPGFGTGSALATGRWKREFDGVADIRKFGAKPNDPSAGAANVTAINAARDYLFYGTTRKGGTLLIPNGGYWYISDTLVFTEGRDLHIIGVPFNTTEATGSCLRVSSTFPLGKPMMTLKNSKSCTVTNLGFQGDDQNGVYRAGRGISLESPDSLNVCFDLGLEGLAFHKIAYPVNSATNKLHGFTNASNSVAAENAMPLVTLTGATGNFVSDSWLGIPAIYVRISDVSGGTGLGNAKFDVSITGGKTFLATGVPTNANYTIPWDLTALNTLINELKADYNAHRVLTAGPVHGAADNTNAVTAADATNTATRIALVNELKADYNAHRILTAGSVHGAADNTNAVTAADATDDSTAQVLAFALKAAYNAHRVLTAGGVHTNADNTNATTAAGPTTSILQLHFNTGTYATDHQWEGEGWAIYMGSRFGGGLDTQCDNVRVTNCSGNAVHTGVFVDSSQAVAIKVDGPKFEPFTYGVVVNAGQVLLVGGTYNTSDTGRAAVQVRRSALQFVAINIYSEMFGGDGFSFPICARPDPTTLIGCRMKMSQIPFQKVEGRDARVVDFTQYGIVNSQGNDWIDGVVSWAGNGGVLPIVYENSSYIGATRLLTAFGALGYYGLSFQASSGAFSNRLQQFYSVGLEFPTALQFSQLFPADLPIAGIYKEENIDQLTLTNHDRKPSLGITKESNVNNGDTAALVRRRTRDTYSLDQLRFSEVGTGPKGGQTVYVDGWKPTDLDGGACRAWWAADRGITLGTTLRATGTTPPAVTISGSLNQPIGLRIEITNTGTKFRWSDDNGTTWIESGITIPLGSTYVLPHTGITATFPNSTYNDDNVYRATAASWQAQDRVEKKLADQATAAKQAIYTANAFNNLPALLWESGVTAGGYNTNAFANVSAQPNYIAVVLKVDDQTATRGIMSRNSSGTGTGAHTELTARSGSLAGIYAGSALQTLTANLTSTLHILEWVVNGANTYLRLDGTTVGTVAGTPGAAGIDSVCIGNDEAAGTNPMRGSICELVIAQIDPDGYEFRQMRSYLKNKWGTP